MRVVFAQVRQNIVLLDGEEDVHDAVGQALCLGSLHRHDMMMARLGMGHDHIAILWRDWNDAIG